MDQSSLNFWENHSLRFLEMVFRADKREVLRNPDGYGKRTRKCGDTVEIFLTFRDGRIKSASFETNGCMYSVACANAAVHLVEGKSLEEAWEIGPETIADYLETLPQQELHCAELSAQALHLALANLLQIKRSPWKRFYTPH